MVTPHSRRTMQILVFLLQAGVTPALIGEPASGTTWPLQALSSAFRKPYARYGCSPHSAISDLEETVCIDETGNFSQVASAAKNTLEQGGLLNINEANLAEEKTQISFPNKTRAVGKLTRNILCFSI